MIGADLKVPVALRLWAQREQDLDLVCGVVYTYIYMFVTKGVPESDMSYL